MLLTDEQRRCRVCGQIAYGTIWLDDEQPNGACPDGMTTPCPTAIRKAETIYTLINDGILSVLE